MHSLPTLLTVSLLFSLFFTGNEGHMYLSSLKVDGKALDEGDCVRLQTGAMKNFPLTSINAPEMTCGWLPNSFNPANRKCPVKAGSVVGLQWYHESPAASDLIVEDSHRGPCIIYMAKDTGDNSPNWFKVYENGLDVPTQTFCTTTLITKRGLMEFTVPADIEPGNYLIRGETIALHESDKGPDRAQPYVGCAEITVSGSGSAKPATVKLPGAYKGNDPGIQVNIYSQLPAYIVPGPAVYQAGSAGSSSSGDGKGGGSAKNEDKGGMSAGGTAALVIFFLALAGVVVFGAFYYHKNGHIFGKSLPPSVSNLFSFSSSSSSSASSSRRNGNYVAYVDQNL